MVAFTTLNPRWLLICLSCPLDCSCVLWVQVYLNALVFLRHKWQSCEEEKYCIWEVRRKNREFTGQENLCKTRETEARKKGLWMCRVQTSKSLPERKDWRGDRVSQRLWISWGLQRREFARGCKDIGAWKEKKTHALLEIRKKLVLDHIVKTEVKSWTKAWTEDGMMKLMFSECFRPC